MTGWIGMAFVSLVFAVVAGWLVPAWAMRALMPTLEASDRAVTNYRGRPVTYGLGLVWPVWAVGFTAVNFIVGLGSLALLGRYTTDGGPPGGIALMESLSWSLATRFIPVLLVLGVFAFGLADDVFGDATAKGFRGHLAALGQGRLTTGALKLLGIGVLSACMATEAVGRSTDIQGPAVLVVPLAMWILGTLVIALSANLVNLTDLRPGRALKTYSLMAVAGVALCAWRIADQLAAASDVVVGLGAAPLPVPPALQVAAAVCVLLVLALGPVFAVWRFDLGERAMLGDAGANTAGAFAGYLLASGSNIWVLAGIATVLLALNVASERVSFSKVIDARPWLRRMDSLGRMPEEAEDSAAAGYEDDGTSPVGGTGSIGSVDDGTRKDGVS